MKGWIRLHRKLQHSEVFKDPDLLRLWMLLLMKASHSERSLEWDGEEIELEPGQFITGRKSLYDEYNEGVPPKKRVNDTTLWNWLKKLEKMGNLQLETAPSRKYSIVSLLQWDEYQTDQEVHTTENNEDPAEQQEENEEEVSEEMSDFLQAGEENGKDLTPAPKEDKPKKAKGKRVYEKGDIEYNLASYLYYWMLQNNPNAKKPNPQKWADVIRLMIERDNRDPEEIKRVIYWSQANDFWKNNILSTEKLRKQYDTLFMQMKADAEKKAKASSGGSSRGARKNDLLREMMEKEAQRNGSLGNNKTLFLNN